MRTRQSRLLTLETFMNARIASDLTLDARCAIEVARTLDFIDEARALAYESLAWHRAYAVGYGAESSMPQMFEDSRTCCFGWQAGRAARESQPANS